MAEVLLDSPVTLTDGAYSEIVKLIAEKNVPEHYSLRVGVKGGGCAGLSYILGFDSQKDNDQVYQFRDITILMEKTHGMYLVGMEIDFVDGLENRGFSFNNPNAVQTCGCGTSFSS
ncbi:MAG: iron-sulfur cluster assembly accessory protein [Chitinophagales bacterium]|nr:iron-sulfur cluster assembly accessory protein [Chitinophagales bacterium]MCB9021498.1 iron-sulfur cluster assembly accessory protein [Chitinophagales bacterium]MCB9032065.1 iron-sulfur cluster assembly accessory protein [Chitinophagales bacterium]HPE98267.1 iron-sulfur cluster assembly accessory protein [Chitinophagales bacterium]HPR29130.1 iron-sulfur cluster assembly accessory protein [Chitinophagales bacterium]